MQEQKVPDDVFKAMLTSAGIEPTDSEYAQVKSMYELFLPGIRRMREVDLDAEDLAVAFDAAWEPNV